MKALTVKQPWAWAIAHGGKRIENRGWSRPWRGPLAVHAGRAWDDDGEHSPLVQEAWRRFVEALPPDNCHHGPLRKESLWMEFGAVIAVADLVDICTVQAEDGDCDCDCGEWAAWDQYHWQLANVRPLAEPVPCKGALGLWTLPEDVEKAVRAQLAAVVG